MSSTHRIALALALAIAFPVAVLAQDPGAKGYPTVGRVEYVLECMQRNGGKQEFLYKCACVIDQIAEKLVYDDFVDASTAARFQGLAGDRGGLFRDPPQTREMAKRYVQVQTDAMKRCGVPR